MQLPENDETCLKDKGFAWTLHEGPGGGFLVLKDFQVSSEKYDREKTDLMIRIPQGYNLAQLDMFYVEPPLRLRETNTYPKAADVFEIHLSRNWQRFSRHLEKPWRAGIDGLQMFFALILPELR